MSEEQKTTKKLEEVKTGYVVSNLPPDTSAAVEGHKVALHDTDLRHPFPHTVTVAGRLPVKVAFTPAVIAAIKDGKIREVDEDEAEKIVSEVRGATQKSRQAALRQRAEELGVSPEALERAMADQLVRQHFGAGVADSLSAQVSTAISSPTPPAKPADDPRTRGGDAGPAPLTSPVDPDKMGKDALLALSAEHGLPIADPDNTTKRQIADGLNEKYGLKPGGAE